MTKNAWQGRFIGRIEANGERAVYWYRTNAKRGTRIRGLYEWGQRNNLACKLAATMLRKVLPSGRWSAITPEVVVEFVEEVLSKAPAEGFSLGSDYIVKFVDRRMPF